MVAKNKHIPLATRLALLSVLNGSAKRNTPGEAPPAPTPAPISGAPAIASQIDPQKYIDRKFDELKEHIDQLSAHRKNELNDAWGEAIESAQSAVTDLNKASKEAKRAAGRARYTAIKGSELSELNTNKPVERDIDLLRAEIDFTARHLLDHRARPHEVIERMRASKQYDERQIAHVERSFRSDSASDGGLLLPEQISNEIIGYNREALVPYRRGRYMRVTKGTMKLPKQNTRPSVFWIGEQTAPTATKLKFKSLSLALKKMGVLAVFSREFLDQVEGVREYVLAEITKSAAHEKQRVFYFGEGTEYRPLGIFQQTRDENKFARTKAGAASTYAEIVKDLVKMIVALRRDNGDGSGNFTLDSVAWLMNSYTFGGLQQTLDGQAQFRFLNEMLAQGNLMGLPFDVSDVVPNTGSGAALTGGTTGVLGLIKYDETVIADSGQNRMDISTEGSVVDSSGNAINLFTQDSSALRMITDQDQVLRHDSAAVWLHTIDWLAPF